ncbi:BPK_HP2_G0014430.mRNA.1.CDS.1 [Saccharomyces cerevisiae]|nr:BPK_HP2_G0014430.mRNA.1.CDS.1 [Saccharomyces cerevisiae]CAI6475874.1 BPK_HP1_G0014260.mRNA.1.CDS.1 [Saccharomyces cerevisiae]CAI6476882.1 BPK_HP2_G0014430.mRNA.1.CDS.1 [Saccharomyces cerevisiae]CAI7255913.1 BPK_collapsed_G0014670.mRNA.1.CDS.1 [Saccharomyces cerevisiae]
MSLYPLQRFESNDTVFSYTLNSKTELFNESRNNDKQHFTLQLIPNANANAKEIDNNNVEIINDLTGNTIVDNCVTTATSSNQLERRLSISDYRTENGNYYEYEFFGRRELNEPLFNNDIVENDDDIDLNNESDVLMVSDDELEVNERFSFLKQQPLDGLNRISSTNNLKNLEIHEFIIDPTENIDDELEDSFTTVPQSKKKVRDYFKLNIFGSSSSSNNNSNSLGCEPIQTENSSSQKMFKNRFFRSRKTTLIKSLPLEQENEVLINSGFDVSSNEESDESDHAIINPLKLVGNNKDISTQSIAKTTNPFKSGSDFKMIEPVSKFSNDSRKDLLAAISEPSSSPSPSAPSPSVQSSSSSHGLVVRKKTGSMQKTRGRKPSLIPDASKQFGCEFCDRRFKRQEHLKRHVRSLHMCEKPFTCHICNKNFSRSDNLNQHVKTHASL